MNPILAVLTISTSVFAGIELGDVCPANAPHLSEFEDKSYLIALFDKKYDCRPPSKADTLLNLIGVTKAIQDKVSGIRYSKSNSKPYSNVEIRNIFHIQLSDCAQRTDGLFECSDKEHAYWAISKDKKEFQFVAHNLPPFRLKSGLDTASQRNRILNPLGSNYDGEYYVNSSWENPFIPTFIVRTKLEELAGYKNSKNLFPSTSPEQISFYIKFSQRINHFYIVTIDSFINSHKDEYLKSQSELDTAFTKYYIDAIAADSVELKKYLSDRDSVFKLASRIAIDSICKSDKGMAKNATYRFEKTTFCSENYEYGSLGYYTNDNLIGVIDSQLYVPVYHISRNNESDASLSRYNVFINGSNIVTIPSTQGITRWSYMKSMNNLILTDGSLWNRLGYALGADTSQKNKGPILDITKYWLGNRSYDFSTDYRAVSLESINISTDGIFGPNTIYALHDRNAWINVVSEYRRRVGILMEKPQSGTKTIKLKRKTTKH